MPAPTFSVLIPCHNAAKWLASAIDSSLACHGVSEVMVVDDGSTDASPSIARSYGDRIRFLEQSRAGGNVARNRLLAAACGEWVQYLDADDYLEPDKVARQFAEAANVSGADVLYSPVFIETWRDGTQIARDISIIDPAADIWTQWILWQLPQTGGALWRRSSLLSIGGWKEDQPCCQEHELYLRALHANLRVQFCPTPGAVYRIWSEMTVCRRDPVQVIKVRTALIDQMLEWLRLTGRLTRGHQAAAGQVFFELARTWARYDLGEAKSYFDERRAGHGVELRGPAAPFKYRLACRLLGFRRAELMARGLR